MTNQSQPPKLKELSWHYKDGFKNQYKRLVRWHGRVHDAAQGRLVSSRLDHSLERDFVLTFCGACFALRDWVKTEPQWASVKLLVDTDPFIMICRDIANVSKHKEITRPSIDGDFAFGTMITPGGHRLALAISPGKLVEAIKNSYEKVAHEQGDQVDYAALKQNFLAQGFRVESTAPDFMDVMALVDNSLRMWDFYLVKAGLVTQDELAQLKLTAYDHAGF